MVVRGIVRFGRAVHGLGRLRLGILRGDLDEAVVVGVHEDGTPRSVVRVQRAAVLRLRAVARAGRALGNDGLRVPYGLKSLVLARFPAGGRSA